MADMWYAECLPCSWEEKHASELDAIEAVTDHVFALHRDVQAAQRAALKIGHVQLRGADAPPVKQEPPPAPTPEPAEPEPAKTITAPAPAESSTAEVSDVKPGRHHGRKSEVF